MTHSKPVILHVLHAWGGGTDKHVNELCADFDDRTMSLIMQPINAETVLIRSANPKFGIGFRAQVTDVAVIIKQMNVALIHIHQLIGHATDFKSIIEEYNIPLYVTLHDYTMVCPRINFIDNTGKFCNQSTDPTTCNNCLSTGNTFGVRDITEWRNGFNWVVEHADAVICPSNDVAERYSKFVPDANYVVVPHEDIAIAEVTTIPTSTADKPLRVAVLGKLTEIKGARVLNDLVDLTISSNAPIQFTLIGQIMDGSVRLPNNKTFTQTGVYNDDDLLALIEQADPHVILFPAIWPETYSYTLSAAMKSGRAIIAPDFGSFPERMQGNDWMWNYKSTSTSTELFDLLVTAKSTNFDLQVPPTKSTAISTTYTDFYNSEYLNIIKETPLANNIVLVTSAIHTNYGIYNTQERIQQTLDTIASVKKYMPDPVIVLLDNSTTAIQTEDSAEFNQLIDEVDYYIDNSDDVDIQHFHKNVTNYDIGKNAMESLGMFKTLSYISGNPELMAKVAAATRIFKLSGRYQITDKFDITKFDNAATADKYVFKHAVPSWIPPADTGVDHQLYTRLWSFTPSLFADTIKMYQNLINNMFTTFNAGKYIDVEHSMAKFIPKDKLVELDVVGLTGNIAPNGAQIVD